MKKLFITLASIVLASIVCLPALRAEAASSTTNEWRSSVLVTLATHTINVALYYNTPLTSATCTVYTTTNELATAGGYTQGGQALTPTASMSGNSAIITAPSVSWAAATFTTNAAIIYDVTDSNRCIGVMKFPAVTKAAATFTLTIPSPLITLATGLRVRSWEFVVRNQVLNSAFRIPHSAFKKEV